MTARRPRARRTYDSTLRSQAARDTRQRVLDVARKLFVSRGYSGLTMQEVADRAGVALDTVYASIGRKPQLVKLLVEAAISNTDDALPPEQRDYVRAIRAASSARAKLAIYAAAVVAIHTRLAPIARALEASAHAAPELAAMWREIGERRARNMKRFAADLLATGEVRDSLTVDRIADVIWATNGPEMYALLVLSRGWSPAEFAAWLEDAWVRLLL